jgi:rare lipoprotein A
MVVRLGAATCVAAIMITCLLCSFTQSANQKQNRRITAAMEPAIVGVASTYNPLRPDNQSGGTETASGEPYDPAAWTAAIQTDLREKFGGVHYGREYRPAYALVASAAKKAIVKINDVGSLEPGRVIDFNEQTMRYFDPTLEHGLVDPITVTPLLGDHWSTGPIVGND